MYYAEAPSGKQQRGYMLWGALASIMIAGSVFTAISVS